LFSLRNVNQIVSKAIEPHATWLLSIQSGEVLERYTKGVRAGVFIHILLPQTAVLFLEYSFVLPLKEAALQALFILLLCRFQSATLAYVRPRIPFTNVESHLASLQRFAQFFLIMPFVILGILLHFFTSASTAGFIFMLTCLEILTLILSSMRRSKAYALASSK